MQVDGGHRQKPIDFQRRHFQNGHLVVILAFWFRDSNFSLPLNINFKLRWHNTYVYGLEPIDLQHRHFQNGRLAAILDLMVSGLSRWHGFRSISQVCFGISISNFICMLVLVIGSSLLIFSDDTTKMAAWWPYWIFWFPDCNFSLALNINSKLKWYNTYVYVFGAYILSAMLISKWLSGSHIGFFCFRTLTLVWLWISTSNLSGTILIYIYIYIWVGAYWFSATSLSKWPPGGHIGFFGFWTNFSLALNINSKLQWQKTYIYG